MNIKTYQVLLVINIVLRLFSYITKQSRPGLNFLDHFALFSSGLFVVAVVGGIAFLISMLITSFTTEDSKRRNAINLNVGLSVGLLANFLVYLGA